MSAAKMDESKTMIRVLITQTNDDGSVKVLKDKEGNLIPLVGGVIFDRLGEALGHVYQEDKYDKNLNRKPEHYVHNWYSNPEAD